MTAADRSPRLTRRALIGGAALMGGFVFGSGSSFVARMGLRYRSQFLPGTKVGGVDVAGMTPQKAALLFESRWRAYLAAPAVFVAPDRTWSPTAEEIGIAVDYLKPLRRAYAWGRQGGIFRRAGEQTAAVAITRDWPLEFKFDRNLLKHYLSSIASLYFQPSGNAEVELRGGEVHMRPSAVGTELDWEAAYRMVRATGPDAQPQEIVIPVKQTVPEFTTEQAREVVRRIDSMVRAPLVLTFEGKGWLLDQNSLKGALVLNRANGDLHPVFDNAKFLPLFDEIDRRLTIEPVHAVANFDQEAGRIRDFQPPRDGRALDRQSLRDRILIGAAFDQRKVDIPIVNVQASRGAVAGWGIEGLVAAGDSFFIDSPSFRVRNIQVAADLLDGVLIEPDELFSFNEVLGPIRRDRGFVDGRVIIEDSTVDAIGGGVCQVSTTMFRAAFWAGLPITERQRHLYRVRYYEQGNFPIGFDASVWQPSLDMKFINDTGSPLMIRSVFDRKRATLKFELWGKKVDRQVEIADHQLTKWKDALPDEWVVDEKLPPETKKQTEWAVKGVYAVLTRRVKSGGKVISETSFASTFVPWPNRYALSPDVAQETQPEVYAKWLERKAKEKESGKVEPDNGKAKAGETAGY